MSGEDVNILDMDNTNGSISISFSSYLENMYLDLKTSVGSIDIDIFDLIYKNQLKKILIQKKLLPIPLISVKIKSI